MAPRGLSAAEKKVKMLEIFHESKEFYTLKEMEKLGPKLKGITQQTVKETLDDLVGDSLVMFDKILLVFPFGSWSSAAVDKANKELETVEARIAQVQAALAAAQKGKEDTPQRQDLLSKLTSARESNSALKTELAAYGAADPVKYERKKRAIEVCKESALRWTDNSIAAIQFGKTTCGMEDEGIKQITGIADIDEWENLKMD